MNKKIIKALSLALVAFMLFAMGAVCMVSAEETAVITNSLGAYPYPYPMEGNRLEYCGWNMRTNTPNSVWFNDHEDSFYNIKAATNGYTDANGVAHPYGVGMHSAINYAPSTVYSIDSFKMTSFKTTVYLVQYDMADEEGLVNIDPTAEQLVPVVVYIDLAKPDEETGNLVWTQADEETGEKTYPVEKSLLKKDTAGENNSVVLEVNEAILSQYTHIRIGIKTRHGIYETTVEGEGEEAKEVQTLIGNTALASVYFADLEITQSEAVPVITAPSIPTRPNTDPAQTDVYDVILPPESDEANWEGKPYGAWMAGSNQKYYLSDMTYLESSNTPNQTYSSGQPTTVNYPYGEKNKTAPFLFGAEGMEYETNIGIGMHPKSPTQPVIGRTDGWTVYNISQYTAAGADTFYALVGLTSGSNEWGSRLSSPGVYVYIYGDKTGDGQHYELLAASELVKGYNLGEFNVNVEGVQLLLLSVIVPEDTTAYSYSGIGFGDACLFTADENAEKPDYSGDYIPPVVEDPTEDETDVTTTTKKPAETTTTPAAVEEEKGCFGVVTGAAGILVATVVAGAACFTKRRDEE